LLCLFTANRAAAQCQSAPAAYSATCTDMESYISPFNATIASQWKGAKPSSAFGTELLSANSNISLTGILSAQALTRVQGELDGLSRLGVQFVTVGLSFPILYQPFFTYNNDPQDYASVLAFYQGVMSAIRQHGMKVLIETTVVFPDYATDLPLKAYYASLSSAEFTAGRAQTAQIVAQQLKPDWLNLGSEPDTISELIGLSAEYTPAEWAAQISTIVSQLRSAGINGTPLIGAGCGAWQQDGSDYVSALMSTGIDHFDMHTFSVDAGMLNDAVNYIDMATAAGKPSAISELWDHKMTAAQLQGLSEYGIIDLLATVEPYNDYSFWAPQDAEFLQQIIDLAYWKQLEYVSPFESELFFANVDYNQYGSLSGTALTIQETSQEGAALTDGTLTPLGKWYAAAIKAGSAATVSSAGGIAPVAPGSLVSIYGSNLAAAEVSATSQPLPNSLGGTSALVTDSSGVQTQLPLIFAGPTQINAVIPASASMGPAVVTINTPSGAVTSPVDLNPVAPTLYAANQNGTGVAAAELVTNGSNGQQTVVTTFDKGCTPGDCTAVAINVGSGSALVLFGTGIQGRAALSDVTVNIGSQTLTPFYAGAAPNFTGLDQVNVMLPASLAGTGTVNVSVTVSGIQSNVVTVTF
jgi:uncharacterized protein (TIGR03437 family)